MTKSESLVTGVAGAGGVEIIGEVATSLDYSSFAQVAIQILIGLVTLFKMIKKPKKENNGV